jgi:hypothetical protein
VQLPVDPALIPTELAEAVSNSLFFASVFTSAKLSSLLLVADCSCTLLYAPRRPVAHQSGNQARPSRGRAGLHRGG